ncbi:CCR4-NOT transcription complex subunit 3 isoform X2 [Patella vulgata]|uniref:CCR4-NOT transcription complex subunit 3 isoform X2 n=1 Tax=Patella vulgata TaxID=6465 RepID=UPI00217F6372|nr:CCR4-NOT transcription complex subunit 3 isoform X2 [Patella vulgata]
MADKRKLQGEIDRCLKKVQEGVETFEDIWNKQNSASLNQKEKYETDLKREIKKLQRQRDQIKSWCASNDIKDKSALLDHRKLIETQMERFKVVERETKTKAYSKEGLGAASKVDPQTKEKEDATNWLSKMIEGLKLQLDQFESEIEQLQGPSKKKKAEREERLESLKNHTDRHLFHIEKLETIMRMVDNETLTVEKMKSIREDVEYYVDSNQDPDFEENEFLYDDLQLEDLGLLASSPPNDDIILTGTPTSTNSSSPSPSPSVIANHSSEKEENDRKRHNSQAEKKNKNNQQISTTPLPSNNKVQITPTKQQSNSVQNSENSTISNHNHVTPPSTPFAAAASGQQNNNTSSTPTRLSNSVSSVWHRNSAAQNSFTHDLKPQANSIDHAAASSSTTNGTIVPSHSSSVSSLTSSGNPSVPSAPSPFTNSGAASAPNLNNSMVSSVQPLNSAKDLPLMNGPSSAGVSILKESDPMSSLKSMAQQAIVNAGLESEISMSDDVKTESTGISNTPLSQAPPQPTVPSQEQLVTLQSQSILPSLQPQSVSQSQTQQTTTIQLNPLLGVAPLGPVPLVKDHVYQLTMLDAAYQHLPHPSDSERLRHYLPRNPCPTPSYYYQLPPPHADSVDFFTRLSTETLFFIFYYMEGTKAQYLAAKALKKQSWRFHTKYMMWFQRHEEPKTITEDFEQGTYIFFDYEKWGQRKKEGFTFEYRYLEDRDLN